MRHVPLEQLLQDAGEEAHRLHRDGDGDERQQGLREGGLEVEVFNGRLRIVREGNVRKFVQNVEQLSYAADVARQKGQEALYVTERAVFQLTAEGLELIEVAPGIDLQRDVIDQMGFRPLIHNPKVMPISAFDRNTEED